VKIDTQELIFYRFVPLPDQATILIEDDTEITLTDPDLGIPPNDVWNSTSYGGPPFNDPGPRYKITVGTAKGNFFEKYVSPWNT